MSWGVAGWPDCAQRIAYVEAAITRVKRVGGTPHCFIFTPTGWRELTCCLPSDALERMRMLSVRSTHVPLPVDPLMKLAALGRVVPANEPRLFGLPYFIEEGGLDPFTLEARS